MTLIDQTITAPGNVQRASEADRKDVVASLDEAATLLDDGATVALGGLVVSNRPMSMVRYLIHADLDELTLVTPVCGLEVDMLLGAAIVGSSSVQQVKTPHVGAGHHQAVGNCFQTAVENGETELWECSEGLMYAGLLAEALSLPFMPWRGGMGTDIPNLNPDLEEVDSPIGDESVLAVPPIEPDVAISHVNRADRFGNGQHLGAPFADTLVAQAADQVILTTEEIIPNRVIRNSPHRTTVPYADYVVEAPFGSHPFECQAAYRGDNEWIQEYIAATETFSEGNEEELAAFFHERMQVDHEAYLEDIGQQRLDALQHRDVGGDDE